jgi:hypothetical protein
MSSNNAQHKLVISVIPPHVSCTVMFHLNMFSQNKTVLNHITFQLSDFWLSQTFSTNVVLCLGDDTVDMGCNATVLENPA